MSDPNQDSSDTIDQSSTHSTDSDSDPDHSGSKYVLGESTINHIDESLQAAADSVDGPLTIDSYEQWRDQQTDSHASVKQIVLHSDCGDTWGDICSSYGIKTSRTHIYDRDTVLEALQRAADAVGEPLGTAEYEAWREEQNENLPSVESIWRNTDKDWRELCVEVNIQPHTAKSYTLADIRAALQEAAADLGEPLVLAEYQSWASDHQEDRPGTKTIKRQFENWATACRESDVEPHRLAQYTPSDPYPLDEILTAIRTAAETKGEPLSPREYEVWTSSHPDHPSRNTCLRRFDNWKTACEKAGVVPTGTTRPAQYTDAELLSALNQAASEIEDAVTLSQYKIWRNNQESHQPAPSTIRQRFESWTTACDKAEVECGTGKTSDDSE